VLVFAIEKKNIIPGKTTQRIHQHTHTAELLLFIAGQLSETDTICIRAERIIVDGGEGGVHASGACVAHTHTHTQTMRTLAEWIIVDCGDLEDGIHAGRALGNTHIWRAEISVNKNKYISFEPLDSFCFSVILLLSSSSY